MAALTQLLPADRRYLYVSQASSNTIVAIDLTADPPAVGPTAAATLTAPPGGGDLHEFGTTGLCGAGRQLYASAHHANTGIGCCFQSNDE